MSNKNEQLILTLLKTCKTTKTIKQLHAHTTKSGLITDQFLAGKFLLHCAVTIPDTLDYARQFLFHFPNPDVFMYNTLIRGFTESNKPQNAILTYIEMRRKMCFLQPDSFSFVFVLKAAANLGCLETGIQLHCQTICCNFDTHLFVGTTLVSMYAECGAFVFAKKVFDEMFEPNLVAWNAIVTACFRCNEVEFTEGIFKRMPYRNLMSWNVMLAGYMKDGQVDLAKRLFLEMDVKDDVSWSTMIVGFGHNGYFDEAFGFFRELHQNGIRPNEVCVTGVLSVCAQAGAFEFGKIIHGSIEKSGFLRIISVNNALLDTYSRCGNVSIARLVFEQMPDKSIVSWTSMIAGLAMHGYGEEAIQVFHKMEESGTIPDGIAFISILYACSHAGLIEQGLLYFSKMTDLYNIEPSIEHYGCMVDLYGRAGQLQKAYEFINQMPIPITEVIWRILLGACSIHGNVKLAERVKERLFELDPVNSSDHVLLSNIYANAGKWNDVASMRRSMVGQNIKKNPGWSMIEVDKIMYRFMVGGKQSKITEEASEKLKEIMLKIRVDGGYVAEVRNVLHDIEDEEKEDAISRHSEKLAVAFGMLRIRDGMGMIRIVKNLRVCGDCHTVMKLISKVYRLEIVVRDRSRFHSFKDGFCSCRDYW